MQNKELENKASPLRKKYRKRVDKKKASKPLPVQILMERTFGSAVAVLALIDEISWEKLTFEMYYICNDLEFKRFIRLYDSQLELAALDQEKFIFGLHKFYNDISRELKEENKYYEFAQFIGAVMQLQFEKKEKLNENIVDAYLSLILQTLEYLRPDKFNLDVYPYGVSTTGEILVGPYPLAYSDMPVTEYEKIIASGKSIGGPREHFNLIKSLYAKYGIEVNSTSDLDTIQQTQMIHCNMATSMFPFINEYTFDIASTTAFNSDLVPFNKMVCMMTDTDDLKEKLKHRNRTLPSNGARFEIMDPTGEIQGLLLKEIVYNGTVHMLYRLDILGSSLSGYYNTVTGFLYSITKGANVPEPYKNISNFILTLYATQVLNSIQLENVSKWFIQGGHFLEIKVFGKAGKIKDVYHLSPATSGKIRDLEHYDKEERQINVIIRNLPEGRQASEEAKELAAQYGYELEEGQTFVRPFIKQVFVKKKEQQVQ